MSMKNCAGNITSLLCYLHKYGLEYEMWMECLEHLRIWSVAVFSFGSTFSIVFRCLQLRYTRQNGGYHEHESSKICTFLTPTHMAGDDHSQYSKTKTTKWTRNEMNKNRSSILLYSELKVISYKSVYAFYFWGLEFTKHCFSFLSVWTLFDVV